MGKLRKAENLACKGTSRNITRNLGEGFGNHRKYVRDILKGNFCEKSDFKFL